MSTCCGLSARHDVAKRTKAVLILPALVLLSVEVVKAIETHQVAGPLTVLHDPVRAIDLLLALYVVVLFPVFFHVSPAHAPAPVVDIRELCVDFCHGCGDEAVDELELRQVVRILNRLGVGTEDADVSPGREIVVEELLLDVVRLVLDQNHQRLNFKPGLLCKRVGLRSLGEPYIALIKQTVYVLEVLGWIVL